MKKLLIGLAVLVAAFLAFVASRPSEVRVERSTQIEAPAAVVLAVVSDFHHWNYWSPWAQLDPNEHEAFSGAASGVGAKFAWQGNDKVGEGRMEITSVTPSQVKLTLEFIKPHPSLSDVDFTTTPSADGVKLTWGMTAHANFIAKLFGLFVNMDDLIGPDFEKGLARIKSISESSARKVISPIRPAAAVIAQPPAPQAQ